MVIDLSIVSVPILVISSLYLFMWILLSIVYLFRRENIPRPSPGKHLVSVILTARNEERVIGELMTDLGKQTYRNLELVVVVHNCTDHTYEKALAVSKELAVPVKVFKLETFETGKAIGLQFAQEKVKGDLMAYFDSDNRVPPETIERLVGWIERGYDAAQARILSKNPQQNRLTLLQHTEAIIYGTVYCSGKHKLGLNSTFLGSGAIFRKAALEAVGGFRNLLTEDYDVTIRLNLAGFRIAYAGDAVIFDEKPSAWRSLLRQRARWLAGELQVWENFSLREKLKLLKDPVEFVYFHRPIALFALLVSLGLSAVGSVFPDVIFWAMPAGYWLASAVLVNLVFSLVLHREAQFGLWRELLLPYLLLVYNFHWVLAMGKSLLIDGWNDTKTEHEYILPNLGSNFSTLLVKSMRRPEPKPRLELSSSNREFRLESYLSSAVSQIIPKYQMHAYMLRQTNGNSGLIY